MAELIKTDIPNLYYRKNSKGKKIYVGVAYSNKKKKTKTLSTSIDLSLKMLIKFKAEVKLLKFQIKFSELFEEYMNTIAVVHSKKEVDTKWSRYNCYFDSIIYKDIIEISFGDLQLIINTMLDVKELSPKTCKNVKQLLVSTLNFAVQQKYINSHSANEISIPKFDNKQDLKITLEQSKDLVHNIYSMKNKVVRAILIFGLHGRRLGEILELKWQQVDSEMRVYKLPWKKNKSRKNLEFSMSDFLYNVLDEMKERAIENNLYSPDSYIFFNQNTLTKYSDISFTWNKIKELSGIDKGMFRFHDFRHMLGTYAIQIGNIPIEKVSHTLGHADISTTQIYISRDAETARFVTSDFLNIFFNDIENLK